MKIVNKKIFYWNAIAVLIVLGCFMNKPAIVRSGNDPVQLGSLFDDTTIVKAPPASLRLDPFYKKFLNVLGIPVISSEKVPDEAFYAVKKVMLKMLSRRKDVLAKLIQNKIRIGIMAKDEVTTDMPEHSDLNEAFPGEDNWDVNRGIGATKERRLNTCAEENVLCYGEGIDPYWMEDIFIHEFAHGIHALGIIDVDRGFDKELQKAFDDAKADGLWLNTYAGSNPAEYFAEGVQDWFNVNAEAIPSDGIHNGISTREELKEYDPTLYNIIRRYFKEDDEVISCHQ